MNASLPMPPESVEWIRTNVWTQAMRKGHQDMPQAIAMCPCMSGMSQLCEMGQHGRCHAGAALSSCETHVTDRRSRVLSFAGRFENPSPHACGPRRESYAMVWLADRVCRWVCPCECHAAGLDQVDATDSEDAGQDPDFRAKSFGVLAIVLARARGRCQCERCPAHRRAAGGRCEAENGTVRLIAAPAYPGARPDREPVITDPDRLVAWCIPCYDWAVARARVTERNARFVSDRDMDALF